MEYQDYWKAFERTGSIMDYLHYTACAKDELAAGMVEDRREYEGGADIDRDGDIVHPHRRI